MKIIVVVPAYNEERTIKKVVEDVKEYSDEVIVVNDGSTDGTAELAREAGARVVTHMLNCGLGASLATGLTLALKQGADIIVTFDADDQHQASDIPRLIEPIRLGQADVAIGSRLLSQKKMPFWRRLYNQLANFITYLLFGMKVTDSQSGLRAFSRKAAEIIKIQTNRMEVSSEIIKEIKANRLRLKEISIQPIYTDYSLSKGQSFFVGVKTFLRLLFHKVIGY